MKFWALQRYTLMYFNSCLNFPKFELMIRRTIIFVTVLSAYLLMLGHDIIPHHHHHHHDHDHIDMDVHHDHHADDSKDESDHNGLPEFFAKFNHAPYQAPGKPAISLPFSSQDCSAEFIVVTTILPSPPDMNVDPPDPPEDVGCFHDVRISSLALRAPPAC